MKFRNCILINFERTHGRTDGRTDKAKAICPFNLTKVGVKFAPSTFPKLGAQ